MDALDRTNLVFAKILDLSMANGVSHWNLSFEDLGLSEDYATHFFPCVEWLEAEGLIRVGDYSRAIGGHAKGWVRNIALTSRGMAVLGQNVEINGEQEQIASAVRKVSGGKVDYHRIGEAIGGVLGGIFKSMGS